MRVPRSSEQRLTLTVVVDVDRDRVRVPVDHHIDVRAGSVLDDVRERFLNDSIGAQIDARRDGCGARAFDHERGGDARSIRFAHDLVDTLETWGRREPARQLTVGSQDAEHSAHLGQRCAAARLDRPERLLGDVGLAPQALQSDARLDGDRADRVCHDVVQFAGDSQALVIDGALRHRDPLRFELCCSLGVDAGVCQPGAHQLGDRDHHRKRDGVEEEVGRGWFRRS